MSKIISALKRTFGTFELGTPVHFHQGSSAGHPEVCHNAACGRPRLS